MNFKGKTDVIAGDGRDLGHATALMLAREGAQVICVDDNAVTKDARLLRRDTTCMHWENARILARHLRRWRISSRIGGLHEQRSRPRQRALRAAAAYALWLLPRLAGGVCDLGENFIPGVFSIQDINFICPIGYLELRGEILKEMLEWRGRPKLEAIVARHADRPSVKSTVPGPATNPSFSEVD